MSESITGYPSPVNVAPPQPSAWSWPLRIISGTQRLRWALWRASRQPERSDLVLALARKVLAMLKSSRLSTAQRRVCQGALAFLIDTGVSQGMFDEAAQWLSLLDHTFPHSEVAFALRWRLLEALGAAGAVDAYLTQAELLFADPNLSWDSHDKAIGRVLDSLWEYVPKASMNQLLDSLGPDRAAAPMSVAARALCNCPDRFESAQEAARWAGAIKHEDLALSPRMRVDGQLVAARAAEWVGDLDAMRSWIKHAEAVNPASPSVRYWALRAQLHDSTGNLQLPKPIPSDGPWQRLALLAALHAQRSPQSAEEAIVVLTEKFGAIEEPERRIALGLMMRALRCELPCPSERLALCSRISAQIELAVSKTFRWTQLSIGLAELCVTRNYTSAARRFGLLKSDPPLAPELFHAAQLLAGVLSSPKVEHPCFAAIESALRWLLQPSRSPAPSKLIDRLASARTDEWCDWLPVLTEVIDTLLLAVKLVQGVPAAETQEAKFSAEAPVWTRWLGLRCRILQAAATSRRVPIADVACGPMAFEAALASTLYGSRLVAGSTLQAAMKTLGCVEKVTEGVSERLVASLSRAAVNAWPAERDSLFGALVEAEVKLLREFVAARQVMSDGDFDNADAQWKRLINAADRRAPLTSTLWEPAVCYWGAMAQARKHPQRAEEALEKLLSGPVDVQVRAQLALLAIARGDLTKAESVLLSVQLETAPPAALYAASLLDERQHRFDAAMFKLDRLTAMTDPGSLYGAAGRRLAAAMCERTTQSDQADALLDQHMRRVPTDAIAAGRLSRIRMRRVYDKPDFEEQLLALTKVSSAIDERAACLEPFKRLVEVVTADIDRLDRESWRWGWAVKSPAWSQVVARRFLLAGRVDSAWKHVQRAGEPSGSSSGAPWFEKTRLILGVHDALRRAWKPFREPSQQAIRAAAQEQEKETGRAGDNDRNWLDAEASLRAKARADCLSLDAVAEAAKLGSRIRQLAQHDGDSSLRFWTTLAESAVTLRNADQVPDDVWKSVAPDPLALIPGLWSASQPRRAQAAKELSKAMVSGGGWGDSRKHLLAALGAWNEGQEQDMAFLDEFQLLESELDSLPMRGSDLWVCAARIWLARKNLRPLVEEELPACVADLSHPGARLIIGLAYARSALDAFGRNDFRSALQRVQQARTTLEDLVAAAAS